MSEDFDHMADAFDSLEMDPDCEEAGEFWHRHNNPKVCNRCGAEYLHWEQTPLGRWRLFHENNEVHVCSGAKTWHSSDPVKDADALPRLPISPTVLSALSAWPKLP